MHTVIPGLCTACELCIPACPVDCITMQDDPAHPRMMPPDDARERFQFHNFRLQRDVEERAALLAAKEASALAGQTPR
jgi:electron transport complex protein RnfB